MMNFKNDKDIRYFYTMVKGEDDEAYILVDGDLKDPFLLGEAVDLENEMMDAFNGNISFTKDPVPELKIGYMMTT